MFELQVSFIFNAKIFILPEPIIMSCCNMFFNFITEHKFQAKVTGKKVIKIGNDITVIKYKKDFWIHV